MKRKKCTPFFYLWNWSEWHVLLETSGLGIQHQLADMISLERSVSQIIRTHINNDKDLLNE